MLPLLIYSDNKFLAYRSRTAMVGSLFRMLWHDWKHRKFKRRIKCFWCLNTASVTSSLLYTCFIWLCEKYSYSKSYLKTTTNIGGKKRKDFVWPRIFCSPSVADHFLGRTGLIIGLPGVVLRGECASDVQKFTAPQNNSKDLQKLQKTTKWERQQVNMSMASSSNSN